jgi:magnesium transporter
VLKTARYVDAEEVVEFGEILLFVGTKFLVAVRHGEASGLQQLRQSLRLLSPLELAVASEPTTG